MCPDPTHRPARDRADPDQGHAPGDHLPRRDLDEARASRARHPDWLVDGWIGSYLMLDTGEGSVTSHTIEHLTGQRPMTLSELLAAEPSSFDHLTG